MRAIHLVLPLLFVAVGVMAAEAPAAPAGKDVTVKGTVVEKAADAKEGVVAILVEHAKKAKEGVAATEEKKHNLIASGELATKITAFVGKKKHVEVTGTETDAGIKVTDIKELEHKAK